jgi:hypothetical protein
MTGDRGSGDAGRRTGAQAGPPGPGSGSSATPPSQADIRHAAGRRPAPTVARSQPYTQGNHDRGRLGPAGGGRPGLRVAETGIEGVELELQSRRGRRRRRRRSRQGGGRFDPSCDGPPDGEPRRPPWPTRLRPGSAAAGASDSDLGVNVAAAIRTRCISTMITTVGPGHLWADSQ